MKLTKTSGPGRRPTVRQPLLPRFRFRFRFQFQFQFQSVLLLQLFVLSAVLFIHLLPTCVVAVDVNVTSLPPMKLGQYVYSAGWTGTSCVNIDIEELTFASASEVRVQLTPEYRSAPATYTEEPVLAWVTDVTTTTFRMCVKKHDTYSGGGSELTVSYMIYSDSSVQALNMAAVSDTVSMTKNALKKCSSAALPFTMTGQPYIFVTIKTPDDDSLKAAAKWVETPDTDTINWCINLEKKWTSNTAWTLEVFILAVDPTFSYPGATAGVHRYPAWNRSPNGQICVVTTFSPTLAGPPDVIFTTSDHRTKGGSHHPGDTWAERLTPYQQVLCYRELASQDLGHDNNCHSNWLAFYSDQEFKAKTITPTITPSVVGSGTYVIMTIQVTQDTLPADYMEIRSIATSGCCVLMYISYGVAPSSTVFDHSAIDSPGSYSNIMVPNPQAGTYYLRVEGGASDANFTLDVQFKNATSLAFNLIKPSQSVGAGEIDLYRISNVAVAYDDFTVTTNVSDAQSANPFRVALRETNMATVTSYSHISSTALTADTYVTVYPNPIQAVFYVLVRNLATSRTYSIIAKLAEPLLLSLTPSEGVTGGGDTLVLSGSNFGNTGTVTVGGQTCNISSWATSEIQCLTPIGQGSAVQVIATHQTVSSNHLNFAYTPPAVLSVSPSLGPTEGLITVTVQGTNFGVSPVCTIGGSSATILSSSHTQIQIVAPPGQGTVLQIQVTAGGQVSNADKTYNYLPPSITTVSPASGNTAGGSNVTLLGTNFGLSGTVEIGAANCPITFHNHSFVICTLPAGQGTGLSARIIVSGQSDTKTTAFSYNGPTLTSVSPLTAGTSSGSILTLRGDNFGVTPSVTIGSQACTLVASNHTFMTCTIPNGVGVNLDVQLTVAGQSSNSLKFSYLAPQISSVSPALLTTAGTTVYLFGSNFGTSAGAVTVGGVSCTVTFQNHTAVQCTATEGQGINAPIIFSVGGQTSNTVYRNYTRPTLSAISPANGPTGGSVQLTIDGFNLGTSGTVTLGASTCVVAGGGHLHTRVLCSLPIGIGANLPVQLTVGSQTSVNTLNFSYDAPTITSVTPADTPSQGGSFITIAGANFGTGTSGGVVTMGGQACSYTAVNYAHTQIVCEAPTGDGMLKPVQVVIGSQTSNSVPMNYSIPSVSLVTPSSIPTAGGVLVTISGSSFSSNGNVSINGVACNVTSFSHQQALCVAGPGEGTAQSVVVTSIDGRSSVVSGSISFNVPSVSSVTSATALSQGGFIITVTGNNFGVGTGTVTVAGKLCNTTSYSHTQIQCAAPAGGGAGQIVRITVGGQVDSASTFSYAAPTLISVTPDHGPIAGGNNITVYGTSFTASSATLTVAGKECIKKFQNHTHIVCEVPSGTGQDVIVQMTATSQQSNTLVYDYDVPVITAVTPSNGPTAGGTTITIDGSDLGEEAVLTIGGLSCPLTADPQTNTRKKCALPIGSGRNKVVSASVLGEVSNLNFLFNYDVPNITSITPSNGPTSGTLDSFAITVAGSSFGATGLVTVNGKTCSPTGAGHSHSSVECLLPEGSGGTVPVVVSVDGQVSESRSFVYDSPDITSISPTTGDTSGGTTITINGNSFGISGSVSIGGRTCPIVNSVYSHKLIHCELPAGQGTLQDIKVSASGGAFGLGSTKSVLFSYNAPTVSSIIPPNGPTAGPPAKITVIGTNFGLTGQVTVAGAVCDPVTAGYLHTRIECLLPAGEGTNQPVRVNVSSQLSLQAVVVSYDRPKISRIVPSNGPTNGGTDVVLYGENFAITHSVSIGGVNCASLGGNHTTLICRTASGTGRLQNIQVTAGGQTLVSPSDHQFSYDLPSIHNVTGCAQANGDGTARCLPQGAQNVTIWGSNFGMTGATVTIGGLDCRNGGAIHDAAMPHNKLHCALPYLVGLDKEVKVVVNTFSAARNLVSYAGPETTAGTLQFCSFGSGSNSILVNQTNAVGDYICVQFDGIDLGSPPSADTTVTFGAAGTPTTYSCAVQGASTSVRIQCHLPSQVVGVNMTFQVHVAAGFGGFIQDSAESAFTISYPAPELVPLTIRETEAPKSPNDGEYIGTLTQGEFVYFDAKHIGSDSSKLSIKYGTSGTTKTLVCSNPTILTASAGSAAGVIRCKTEPGEGGPYRFEVTALNQVSVEGADRYKYPVAPIVYRVEGCPVQDGNSTKDCPTDGGSLTLTIIGAEFTSSQLSAKVGVNDCVDIVFGGSRNFTCSLPAGAGVLQPVVVVTGAKFSRSRTLLSYAYPNITSVQGCAVNSASSTSDCARIGNDNITVTGTNFGASDSIVLIGGQTCTNVAHAASPNAHTQVVCTTPSGTTTDRALILIQNNGEISSNTGTVSYKQCPVGEYAAAGVLACQPCAKGSYSDTAGLFACKQCEAGEYQDETGQSLCKKCPVGRYSTRVNALGAHNCTACPEGEFASLEGQATCEQCPPGQYNNITATTACQKCVAGTYTSSAGQTECTDCSAGTFSPSDGAVSCRVCQAGQYADVDALSACKDCLAGQYRGIANPPTACLSCAKGAAINVKGQASCIQCDSGKFSNATGLDVCYSCPAGQYSTKSGGIGASACSDCGTGEYINVDGQATCLKCAKGTYQPSTGRTLCDKCPTGTAQNQLGFSTCSNCTAGTYAGITGTVVCEDCPAGTYTNLAGMSACTGCSAGTFQQLAGQSLCSNCAKGSAIQSTGQVACKQCNSGFYANTTGQAECSKCPVGMFSTKPINSGPTVCEACTAGRFVNAAGQADCVDCPVGFYNTGTGESSCAACIEGTFTSAAASTVCTNCTAGSYAPGTGSITCKECPVGTFSTSDAASGCSDCAAGTFQADTGKTACAPCAIGSFTASSGQALCLQCPTGRFNTEAGSTNCTACAPGTYQDEAGKSTCKRCPIGEYVSSSGQSLCLSCPLGTYGDSEALTACLDCRKGMFSDAAGSTQCTNCTSGRFSATDGLSYCDPCAGGTFNSLVGQSACSSCSKGTYQSAQGKTSCSPCPAGTANNALGQLVCADCPVGAFSNDTGAHTCFSCPAGTISTSAASTGCTNCTAGRFSVADGSFVCEECDVGKYGPYDGMSTCTDCGAGTYQSSAGQTVCTPCAKGSAVAAAGQRECTECSSGSYANATGSTACTSCPAGSFSVQPSSSSGATTCTLCAAGTFSGAIGQGLCASCPVGYFSDTAGTTACTACATGTYTASAASTVCQSCGIGRFSSGTGSISCPLCPIGTKGNRTGLDRCFGCAAGEFQSQQGQSRCDQCDAGKYASATGQALCLPCEAGTVAASSGASVCQSCSPGTFQADAGQTTCSPCAAGSAVAGTGEPVCTQCEPGTFANTTGQSACHSCSAGRYSVKVLVGSSLIGATRCTDCAVGTFSVTSGQGVCTPCSEGTYAITVGLTSCLDCAKGFYAPLPGTVECDECPAGQYNPAVGQSVCFDCLAGTYSDSLNATVCQQCGPGLFQPQDGQSSCSACVAGTYNPVAGQTACTLCATGSYSNSTRATVCDQCAAGSFQVQIGQSSCTACAVGRYTSSTSQSECLPCDYGEISNVTGSTVCSKCSIGYHQSELAGSVCSACAAGTYSDSVGAKNCRGCDAGHYVGTTAATTCLSCPPGFSQIATGASTCDGCALGRFNPSSGQAECTLCGRGTYSNGTRMSTCLDCPRGTFNPGEGQTSCRLCSPGYFSQSGNELCEACGDGTIAAVSGSEVCVACAINSAPNFFKTECDCDINYYLASSSGNSFECSVCPSGANCETTGTTFRSMTALTGYWRAVNTSLTFHRCILRKHCLGGRDATSGASQCESSHTGPLCAVCKDGFYATAGGNCATCPDNESASFLYMFLIGCAVVVFVWLQLYIILRADRALLNRVSQTEELDEWERISENEYGNFDEHSRVSNVSGFSNYSMSMSNWSERSQLQNDKEGPGGTKGAHTSSHPGSPSDTDSDIPDVPDAPLHDDDAVSEADSTALNGRPQSAVSSGFGEDDDDKDDDDYSSDYSTYSGSSYLTGVTGYTEKQERFYRLSLEHSDNRLTVHGPPKPKPNFTYKLKIALGFAQIISSLGSGLEIQWPTRFKEFILWLDMFNVDFILVQGSSADCLNGVDYYRKYLTIAMMPIIIFVVISLIYLVPRYFGLCCYKHMGRAERTLSTLRFWKMFLYLLFLIYPSVSSTVLRLYVCKDIEDKSYLLADLSVECYTDQWTYFSYASLGLVVLYPIGIPLFFLAMMLINRRHLQYDRVKAQLGFLYAGYRLDVWYFEVVDTLHKLFLTSVLAFFPSASQLPLGMTIATAYTMALLIIGPYIRKSDDQLHLLAQVEIFLLLCAGNVFYHLPLDAFDDQDDLWLSITLMAMTLLFVVAFFWSGIVVVYRMIRNFCDSSNDKDSKDVDSNSDSEYQSDEDESRGGDDVETASRHDKYGMSMSSLHAKPTVGIVPGPGGVGASEPLPHQPRQPRQPQTRKPFSEVELGNISEANHPFSPDASAGQGSTSASATANNGTGPAGPVQLQPMPPARPQELGHVASPRRAPLGLTPISETDGPAAAAGSAGLAPIRPNRPI
jgi:IPT/TIG domain/Tyrosine-protein kinase ephrin type A/B receptor-like